MVRLFVFFVVLIPFSLSAQDRLTLAVSASFKPVIDELVYTFEQQSGIQVRVSSASSGVLVQQILNGAPFDIFFSADEARPEYLRQVLNLSSSQVQTYAVGELVLISRLSEVSSVEALSSYRGKLIMANPKHAPYGVAAANVLANVGFQGVSVQANNVVQARQYLTLNLAPVGLIAKAVAMDLTPSYPVDVTLYQAIIQKYAVINPTTTTEKFLNYMSTAQSQKIIEGFGYQVPLH